MEMKIAGIMLVCSLLAACGGGGGSSGAPATTPPAASATVTKVCPGGTSQTAATAELAVAACPATTLTVTSPASGSVNVSPVSLVVTVASTGTLDPSTVTAQTVTLEAGTMPAAGTLTMASDAKSFTLALTGTAYYEQTYTVSIGGVKDTVGRVLPSVTGTFTTAAIACVAPQVADSTGTTCVTPPPTCAAPQVWTAGVSACVYPMGVKVFGAGQLPTGCNTWKDQCWADSVANGTVKWIATTATMTGYNNRPIVFAFIHNTTTGLWDDVPFYADDGTTFTDISGGVSSEIDWVYGTDYTDGTPNGIILHDKSTGLCFEDRWYPAGDPSGNSNVWATNGVVVTCP